MASWPFIPADAAQIRQLLVNLILNAVEAIQDEGGVIRVLTLPAHLDRSALRGARFVAPDLIEGEAVALEVSDSGPGMAPEIQARMFEPFFSTKFRGRGLGLAVVLGIVRAHKGAIQVESAAGQGTTVRVILPASLAQPMTPLLPPAETVAPPATWTILIADDEESVRTVTCRMLEASGFRVVQASDGREALETFRQNTDAVRLVLLDLTMPNLNGEDAFRQLRQLRPDVPVILMSGYPEPDVMSRFVGAGLTAFLQKPFRPLELLDLVRRHFPAA
jgi:CheY-like chemotaxis protein